MLKIDSEMLKTIADLHEIPSGAYNIEKTALQWAEEARSILKLSLRRISRVLISNCSEYKE